MKTYGIVAEFNPFHKGHEYLIKEGRKDGAEGIVCVMSGNFVQRGEPAVCSKWRRAEMALNCGADLVLELPVMWAVASAERFAAGAVSLMDGTGCVDKLLFGCEESRADELFSAASLCLSDEYGEALKDFLSQGLSFPAAREKAVLSVSGERNARVLKTPNNILGVEYCKAILTLGSNLGAVCVNRKGAAHDSAGTDDEISSASAIVMSPLTSQRPVACRTLTMSPANDRLPTDRKTMQRSIFPTDNFISVQKIHYRPRRLSSSSMSSLASAVMVF